MTVKLPTALWVLVAIAVVLVAIGAISQGIEKAHTRGDRCVTQVEQNQPQEACP